KVRVCVSVCMCVCSHLVLRSPGMTSHNDRTTPGQQLLGHHPLENSPHSHTCTHTDAHPHTHTHTHTHTRTHTHTHAHRLRRCPNSLITVLCLNVRDYIYPLTHRPVTAPGERER